MTLLSSDSAAPFFSIWNLEVGYRGRYILVCPFFWADGARGNTDVLVRGASTEVKKRVPTFSHKPLATQACGK